MIFQFYFIRLVSRFTNSSDNIFEKLSFFRWMRTRNNFMAQNLTRSAINLFLYNSKLIFLINITSNMFMNFWVVMISIIFFPNIKPPASTIFRRSSVLFMLAHIIKFKFSVISNSQWNLIKKFTKNFSKLLLLFLKSSSYIISVAKLWVLQHIFLTYSWYYYLKRVL